MVCVVLLNFYIIIGIRYSKSDTVLKYLYKSYRYFYGTYTVFVPISDVLLYAMIICKL